MILDLVEEVGEISVLALLLEWAHQVRAYVVILVIHLLSPLLIVSIVSVKVHEVLVHQACAIRILKVYIVAHLTVVTCVPMLTVTESCVTVVVAKAIALHHVRVVLWHAHSDLAQARLFLLLHETGLALMTQLARVRRWAVTLSRFHLFSFCCRIALFRVVLGDRVVVAQVIEAVFCWFSVQSEVDIFFAILRVFAAESPAGCIVTMIIVFVNLIDAVSVLLEVEEQLGLVFIVEVFLRDDEVSLRVPVLESANLGQVREFVGYIPEVNLPIKVHHQLQAFTHLYVILARWVD